MAETSVAALIDRWNSPEGHPYKGSLIDWSAYQADPDNIGCMCAQGQALHLVGGIEPRAIRDMEQSEADKVTSSLLGISRAHAVLLRSVNDSVDGAPAIVLTNPELVLGDQAETVLAFWRRLDRMTPKQWDAARAAAWEAARDAARAAAWEAARDAARDAAGDAAGAAAGAAAWEAARDAARAAAWEAARDAARAAAWEAARDAARAAARDAARAAARDAARATNEIQGAELMRERGQPFYFLPLFGFVDPEAVLAAGLAA